MTRKFLHIGFNFDERPAPAKRIQKVLDKALDWILYAPNCYIVYTSRDSQHWYRRLRDVLDEDDNIFVVELNIENRQGWLPKSVWEWIKKPR
jgi:hypothetical protein